LVVVLALISDKLAHLQNFRKPLGEPNPQASNLALAVVLLVVIILQAVFNAWQDFSTSRVMSSIKDMIPTDVVVLRDGSQSSLAASELVPGDLVQISLGQKVPADLRLIEVSSDLRFDRSVLTGEVSLVLVLEDGEYAKTQIG
jgi:sodium/potassium-transporting ATPase subunit alpha